MNVACSHEYYARIMAAAYEDKDTAAESSAKDFCQAAADDLEGV